jgi:UDP-2-acetamido-3-amino-2,3-dideoxy-glucuronate N-acetyltransferase
MHDAMVHPTAVVDSPASIGRGSKIWHFCHICAGATIGQDCVIGQNGYVASTVTIGNRCRIQNNVSLYDGVRLEDDVFVGPSVVFTNVVNPRAAISRRSEYRATRIGHGATIGANATIVAGINLGPFCFIAAGAVVTRDVPAFALVAGVPARLVGWMSRVGQRLHFTEVDEVAVCPSTGERYRLVDGLAVPIEDGSHRH